MPTVIAFLVQLAADAPAIISAIEDAIKAITGQAPQVQPLTPTIQAEIDPLKAALDAAAKGAK